MARATVKTLALLLGVSPSTVSNAYNRPDQLSEALRTRILAKATEIGYAGPDAAARTLRSGRAGAVGVLLTERLSYAFSDPFAVGFLTGLSEVVEDRDTSILLLPLTMTDDREPDVTTVRQANIDALTTLCLPPEHPASVLARVRGIHLVSTYRDPSPTASWVAIDDEEAGALVGRHLRDLGHTDVTLVVDTYGPAGSPGRPVSTDALTAVDYSARVRGITTAMPRARISLVSGGHNARVSGVSATTWILAQDELPTAIVGLSDVLALGVLETLRGAGVDVPGAVSVVGFDDIDDAGRAGLTTLHQPIEEKGRLVGELLLDPDRTEQQVLLPIRLELRATSGPER